MPNQSLTPPAIPTALPTALGALLCLTTVTVVRAETPAPTNAEQGWSSITRCAQEDTERARHTCLDKVLRDAGLLTNEMRAQQQRRAFGLDDKAARATASTAPSPGAAASTAHAATTAPIAASAPAAVPAPTAAAAPAAAISSAATGAHSAPATSASTPAPAHAATPAPTAKAAPTDTTPSAAAAASPEPPDRLDVELTKVQKAVNGRLFVTTSDGAVWLQTESVTMPIPPVPGDRMSIRKATLGGYVCSVASTHLTYRCTRNR